eukprot:7322730-Pyramimonas_sp.AAC.2
MAHFGTVEPRAANTLRTSPEPPQNHPRTTREPLLNHSSQVLSDVAPSTIIGAPPARLNRLTPETTPEPS